MSRFEEDHWIWTLAEFAVAILAATVALAWMTGGFSG